ncbi:hypothetical protein NIES4106_58000 (plasmid) [Fischerella sp. NIES-4106]|nr:hypothetical protein NIES4106_58000 [Fischerella sp. NIES-4106]
MQYQDILTITIFAITITFATLMLLDFVALTLQIIRQAIASHSQPDFSHNTSTNLTHQKQTLTFTIPDPWTLPIECEFDEVKKQSQATACLFPTLLLPPATVQSKPSSSKSKKTTTVTAAPEPKRRGRPSKKVLTYK